jgi:hypothetical protein
MNTVKLTKSAKPVLDEEVYTFLKSLDYNQLLLSGIPKIGGTFTQEYIQTFKKWINQSHNFRIDGLEDFSAAITDGVTGAFPNFLYFKKELTPVVLKGEYPLHRLSNIDVLGKIQELKTGQKLYLSHPFSAYGDVHPEFQEILETTKKLNIPIFLDCAYICTSKLETLNLSDYPSIEFIAFSLSKVFSTGRVRSGVCFSKFRDVPMHINTDWDYLNQLSLATHIELMNQFDANYFYKKYKNNQLELCKQLKLTASSSYLFGLTKNDEYSFFSREKIINRVCLTKALEHHSMNDINFIFSEK